MSHIISDGQLYHYNRNIDAFELTPFAGIIKSVATHENVAAVIDIEGEIWITTPDVRIYNPDYIPTFTKISEDVKFKQVIFAGKNYRIMALDSEGNIWYYGDFEKWDPVGVNININKVFNKVFNKTNIFTQWTFGVIFTDISADNYTIGAADIEGNFWAMGSGYFVRLGLNTSSALENLQIINIPIRIKNVYLFSNPLMTMFIDFSGNVWALGMIGGEERNTKLIQITDELSIKSIAANHNRIYFVTQNGNLFTQGYEYNGVKCVLEQIFQEINVDQIIEKEGRTLIKDIHGNFYIKTIKNPEFLILQEIIVDSLQDQKFDLSRFIRIKSARS